MQSRFWKLHTCWMLRHGNVGVWTFGFLCKHGTLLVCSCVHMVRCWCVMCRLGWGWGGDAFTFLEVAHMLGCYAAATLVCELSVFDVNMVRCWCVHVYTWYVAGFWKLHTFWMLRHGNVGVWTFGFLCKHGTLLVCSCVHMVRCWCVMCRLGWGWGGDASTLLEVAHMLDATPRQRWCVNFRFFM